MKKILAFSVVLLAFTAGAFAQTIGFSYSHSNCSNCSPLRLPKPPT
jgi:hypothetical protein